MTAITTVAPDSATEWHGLTAEEACRRLDVDPAVGLSAAEVTQRRQQYGSNKLAEEAKEPTWKAFLRQYRDLMQLVLLGAAVVSIVAIQDVTTGLVVIGLTVVNALMGLHQEGKAAESVAALRQMLIMTAGVRRDGQLSEVPAEELVPGDIVGFEAGDKVPADGRILVSATLEIEEAGLTGESTPVAKDIDPVSGTDVPLGDRVDMAYMNSQVTRGTRRDGRDGHRDVDRGRSHLRDAQRSRSGEDAAHQAARPVDRDHHVDGGGGARAHHHSRPGAR